jgi:anti-sigma B factor antagonist
MPEQATGPDLKLDVEQVGDAAVVRCQGRLVTDAAEILFNRVKQLIPVNRRIVLNLGALTRMDSSGLGALVRLYVSARSAGCDLQLMNLGRQIHQMLGTANLLDSFTIVGEQGMS